MISELGVLYRPQSCFRPCEYFYVSPTLWPSASTSHKLAKAKKQKLKDVKPLVLRVIKKKKDPEETKCNNNYSPVVMLRRLPETLLRHLQVLQEKRRALQVCS